MPPPEWPAPLTPLDADAPEWLLNRNGSGIVGVLPESTGTLVGALVGGFVASRFLKS